LRQDLKGFRRSILKKQRPFLNNLDTYFKALCVGANPVNIQAGFIHHEPEGIKALDQKGGKGNLMQSRLYIFPETGRKIMHVISIGTKTDQSGDISECRDYIQPLKEKKMG
jgi:hypothetical protein